MPAKKNNNKDNLLKELLQEAIDSGDPELIALAKAALKKKPAAKAKKRGRPAKATKVGFKSPRGQASFDGNEFNPDEYKDMFRVDTIDIDSKIKMHRPTPKRPPAEEVEVTCSRCNKTEYIPQSCAMFGETQYYVCPKCGSPK